MGVSDFIRKQFIDVIEWTEADKGTLAYRFPMRDREIQTGAMLTVRESQMAAFVNEGRTADILGPGVHRLSTRNLPLLTDLMNWDKFFESPFKSDVYFFSTRLQVNQGWGTATPITTRDAEFGLIQLRAYGIYAYRVADPRKFYLNVSGSQDIYRVTDLEGQLRALVVGRLADIFAESRIPFLDMAANQVELGRTALDQVRPAFADLGLALESVIVQSLSMPEEVQKRLDERVGMSVVGDLGRYTQFQAAQSLPIAAASEGGAAGAGVGLGAGIAMAQGAFGTMKSGGAPAGEAGQATGAAGASKFCIDCGKTIPQLAKFCPVCGKPQG